ncbi:fibronectin type III domain-containing protein [Streptomyces sp. CA-250714]|uniref:fibronectin type III domain-containing protein n=1 Tax=Streptomyces sp. CA-250714 TaxID=3240060 RepID=UPI003D8FB69E
MPDARGSSEESRTPGLRPRRLVDEAGETDQEGGGRGFAALKARCAGLARSAWTAVRPNRRRTTGYIALCSVSALVGTSIVVGSGKAGAVPDLADVGAWLTSSRTGEAAHANGLTGDVDGKVKLPGMGDHPVSISQDGKTVLVLDEKTGKLVRIDPSQLTVEQSSRYGTGLQLVSGGRYAYLVDPVKARVQRIDPVRTTPIGAPVDLGRGPLGKAVADRKGTLWVPVPGKGTVVPFPNGKKAPGIKVAGKSGKPATLVMTLADGRPVVTDTKGGTVTLLNRKGRGMRFKLPSNITKAPADSVLVPAATAGDVVPVLAKNSGRMALVNTRTGSLLTASLGSSNHEYGTPQVLGSKVYVPDESNGTLKVYDTDAAAITKPVKVTGKPGKLSLFVRDGLLWVNDADNATAVVINSSGHVNRVHKYDTDVPSGRKPKENDRPGNDGSRDPAPGPNAPNPLPEGPSGPGRDDTPSGPDAPADKPGGDGPADKPARKPKKPLPSKPDEDEPAKPQPPGVPQAESASGAIRVSFAPSSGVKPTGYRLKGAPAGAEVQPAKVGPGGPFTFEVKGGSCDQQYTFSVVAEFAGGDTEESGRSGPARPCVAPGQPQNVKFDFPQGGKGINLTWQAPANAGNGTTYTVTGGGPDTDNNPRNTAARLRNLKNFQTYNLTIAAKNAAGSGGSVVQPVNLSNTKTIRVADNVADGDDVGVRSEPTTQGGTRRGSIPAGETPELKVICQVKGSPEEHDTYKWKSDVWDRIEWDGGPAYISDLWVGTSNHKEGKFSPEVWPCE